MSATLLIVLGALLVVMVLALTVGRGPGGRPRRGKPRVRRPRSLDGTAERESAIEAQAEVEEHDIEEMLAARNALRRRIGRPELGDELGEQARREREGA